LLYLNTSPNSLQNQNTNILEVKSIDKTITTQSRITLLVLELVRATQLKYIVNIATNMLNLKIQHNERDCVFETQEKTRTHQFIIK